MKPVDLEHGVVPISRAASALAALIKRSRTNQQPIVITQKGYPKGVLLGIEIYTELIEHVTKQPLDLDLGMDEEATED